MSHSVEVQPVPLENPGLLRDESLQEYVSAKLSGRDLYHQAKWYIKSNGHGFSMFFSSWSEATYQVGWFRFWLSLSAS